MSNFETANVMVALGGDIRNSVPRYGVTAAEAAVLRVLHGETAVFDIAILPDKVTRTHRQEIVRLHETYGRSTENGNVSPAVAQLYPGAAARAFEEFAELELPEELFVATGRRTVAEIVGRAASWGGDTGPDVMSDTGPNAMSDTEFRESLSTMRAIDLQAYAARLKVDLTGITRKQDIVDAVFSAVKDSK